MIRKVIGLVLCILSLNAHAQVETIKVVSYNLMWYKTSSPPCNHSRTAAQRDADLQTIVSYLSPDIMVVQELGTAAVNPLVLLTDVFNVNGVSHYQRAGNSGGGSSIGNMLFYNKDKLVLETQQALSLNSQNAPLVRLIDFYHLYVKDQGLGTPGVDTVWMTIGVAHLKAGSSSSDISQRDLATEAVMEFLDNGYIIKGSGTNADTLSISDNILFAGDFNVKSASAGALQNLVNYGPNPSISLKDPISQLGAWNNNNSFANYHTQSTHANSLGCFSGGGMDDRFDLILSSDAILNNAAGLNYIGYQAVGQDGGSCCGGDLNTTTNFSINSTVAGALFNFSDHLPVEIELEATVSGIGISEEELIANSWSLNNPFTSVLNLRFKDKLQNIPLEIALINLRGELIGQWSNESQNEMEIATSGLAAGMYLLQLSDGKHFLQTRKVVKR
jgi:hypothetical protein